jgi:alkanesulfonate monooxygenase SsuD/methylene tetrahydromethanopterin reductase-like flavin-dependent oxidoreductase (luciferase family)
VSLRPLTFGWIMQPALFDTPEGHRRWESELARGLIETNEAFVERARAAGFETIWVEDHMGWGDKAHLECFTNMAWLAGRHPGLRYGTMVCGQAFRNPAYLAKLATNMDLLTGGRFILGIGAGNNGLEHEQFGFPFLPAGERLGQTEEAIRIIQALWAECAASFSGRYYRIDGACSSPLPDRPIPLMIGGGGEKKTLRLVAELADWWCSDVGPVETFVRKNKILDEHCAAVGRDPAEVARAQIAWVSVEDDPARVVRWDNLHIVAGSPEEVADELGRFRAAGVEHFQLRFMDYPSLDGLNRFCERVLPRLIG